MKNTFLKNTLVAIMSTIIFFGIGEVIFRAFFSEYGNFIIAENITFGKAKYMMDIPGAEMRARKKGDHFDLKEGDHMIFLVGDSVSMGYGLAYDDIYWNYWQRNQDLEGKNRRVIALTSYGNNSGSNLDSIREDIFLYQSMGITVDGIIYQFNLNDIVPFTPEDIKAYRHLKSQTTWVTGIIIKVSEFRLRYLNRSVMLRVLSNKLTHLVYDNSKAQCEDLGYDALAEYTYTFIGKGYEEMSERLWTEFEEDMAKVKEVNSDIPMVILLSPIAEHVEPEMKMHKLSRPRRFDCATIDPVERMKRLCERLGIAFVNSTDYIKTNFESYKEGDNPIRFFFINDDNHLNEVGSKFFAEYSYDKIFREGIIK